ncbi:MAG: hypothetical protein WD468_09905 [Pirellulales bacterium]
MRAWLTSADGVLRQAPWVVHEFGERRTLLRLLTFLVLFGLLYGAVMGSFRVIASQPQWGRQMVYSAVKVPLLLSASFVISLPSFFVLNSLLGLRSDFSKAVRALVAAQAGLAIILASLAPLTLLWYASSSAYNEALLFNGAMFAVASFSAQWLVRGYYRPLVAQNPRHRWLLWGWLVVYTLVAIQMAWLLRPFVGSPTHDVVFFRPNAWDNAYVIVSRIVWQTLFP